MSLVEVATVVKSSLVAGRRVWMSFAQVAEGAGHCLAVLFDTPLKSCMGVRSSANGPWWWFPFSKRGTV